MTARVLTKGGLPICDGNVHVVLFAVLVDAEALEIDVAPGTEIRFDWTWEVDRGLQVHIRHAVLDHLEVHCDHTGHLDGATEGDLSISLFRVAATTTVRPLALKIKRWRGREKRANVWAEFYVREK